MVRGNFFRQKTYLSLNMPFFPKIFRIPRPISFFLAKKNFSRFARKRSSEAQFRKQIRGERRFPTPPPSAGTPPFSLESVTLVAEKQRNSAFKRIPHLFSVKLVGKPRYATFLKNALTIAPFFTAKLCHGKDVMQACAAGAWYATFFFALILLSHSSLLPKGSGEATVRNISLKC